jgi:hypothetical protein
MATNPNTKSTNKSNTKTNTKTTKPSTSKKTVDTTLEHENKNLRSEIDELKKMFLALQASQLYDAQAKIDKSNTEEDSIIEEDDYEEYGCEIEIPSNKYIKVISLTPNMLVISTEGYGKGKVFKFNKFGQSKDIIYNELVEIIHNQQSFIEKGKFYIMNKDVIKKHDLEEIYEKILTKKTIENILNFDTSKIDEVFRNATQSQQETIVSILIQKIRNGEEVDLNKLDIINKIYGRNIKDLAIGNKQEDEN